MLEEFIRRQITKVASGIADAPANPAECMEIKRVAARSVAAAAGVAVGDWLVSMNGRTAAKLEGYPYQQPFEEGLYRFYAPGRRTHYRLWCTGIDIGMELRPTPPVVAAVFDAHSDPSMLGIIWEQGDWPMLAELCRRELPGLAGRRGFFHRLFGVKPTVPNTPVLAFLGAALYEQGDKARGLKLIRQYDAEFRKDWTVKSLVARFNFISSAFCSRSRNEKGAGDAGVKRDEFRSMRFGKLEQMGIGGPRCRDAPCWKVPGCLAVGQKGMMRS